MRLGCDVQDPDELIIWTVKLWGDGLFYTLKRV